MSYRLKLTGKIGNSALRVALRQITAIESRLTASGDAADAVHDARKSLKRLRSLFALLRPALGEKCWQRENRRYRNIARLLAGTREAHALGESLNRLEARFGAAALGAARVPLAAVIDLRCKEAVRRAARLDIPAVLGRLKRARKALRRLPIKELPVKAMIRGIGQTYAEGRRRMKLAYRSDQEEAFHEWRKPEQQHWRQMELVTRAWPAAIGARVELARELSDLLGEEHDLWVLRTMAQTSLLGALDPSSLQSFLALCKLRQRELRAEAQPLGTLVYAEPPRRLSGRIAVYWGAAIMRRRPSKTGAGFASEILEPPPTDGQSRLH